MIFQFLQLVQLVQSTESLWNDVIGNGGASYAFGKVTLVGISLVLSWFGKVVAVVAFISVGYDQESIKPRSAYLAMGLD